MLLLFIQWPVENYYLEMYIPNVEFMKRTGWLIRKYQLSFVDACVAQLTLDNTCLLASFDQKAFKQIKGIKLLDL